MRSLVWVVGLGLGLVACGGGTLDPELFGDSGSDGSLVDGTTGDGSTTDGATDGSVTDGPLPEGIERIGGVTIIDAPTREVALEWAAKIAVACRCAQEVREFMFDPES